MAAVFVSYLRRHHIGGSGHAPLYGGRKLPSCSPLDLCSGPVGTGVHPGTEGATQRAPRLAEPTGLGLEHPSRRHDPQRPSPFAGRDDQSHARVSAPGSIHCAPADAHRQLALAPGHELTEALSAKHQPAVSYYKRAGAGPRTVGGTPDSGAERVPQISGAHHERQWCRRQIADQNGARRPSSSLSSAAASS